MKIKKINRILLEIYLEEKKRERKIEEIWNSLTDEDRLYMENIELFIILKNTPGILF